jgi:hypothetical protein
LRRATGFQPVLGHGQDGRGTLRVAGEFELTIMRITLNLSPAASMRDRYALAWAIPAALAGIVALVFLVRATRREYREYSGIRSQVAELQARANDFSGQESAMRKKFDDPANRELLHQVKFVNTLINQRVISLTEVTSRVASFLPDDAHLTGIGLAAPKKPGDDYVVRIGISAKSEDAVESFINDMEDSPDFKDVSIINQGFSEEAAQPDKVVVVCTARYVPGTDLTTGKTSAEESTPNHKSDQ